MKRIGRERDEQDSVEDVGDMSRGRILRPSIVFFNALEQSDYGIYAFRTKVW